MISVSSFDRRWRLKFKEAFLTGCFLQLRTSLPQQHAMKRSSSTTRGAWERGHVTDVMLVEQKVSWSQRRIVVATVSSKTS